MYLTKKQACRFLLLKQGLLGDYRFRGETGVLEFVRQAGCVQFDPIDICGKNPELVLQSRVKGFTKDMLFALLYQQRQLVDFFDKNLSIFPVEDWKYFARTRSAHKAGGRSRGEVAEVEEEIKARIRGGGPVCSADLNYDETVQWYWSDTRLSRAALETLYFRGELAIHHKKQNIKYYDLAENCIPAGIYAAPEPFPKDCDHLKWRVLRRVGGVGLLWNRASDAWLGIPDLKSGERDKAFSGLLAENKITEIQIEGIKEPLYCLTADLGLLQRAAGEERLKERCEFLAPLDNLLWDRRLIKALFGFEYKWEIYTPMQERKFGYYTLPVLFGERFIGRVEAVNDKKEKCLVIKNLWLEESVRETKRLKSALERCAKRFARFNGCKEVVEG